MKPQRYSELEIAAVYRAIAERRDMRHFKPGPIDSAVLLRLVMDNSWECPNEQA